MSTSNDIESLSKTEVRIIAELEFDEKYYFTRNDIKHHFDSESKLRYTIHRLISKKRIIGINKNKYYLIPIKAKYGRWSDNSYIIADEMFNGKDYYIGGWSAANYWRLTEQVPMKIEIYTNKRNGRTTILNNTFIFRKTTQKRIDHAIEKKINNHTFKILGKEESAEWIKSKNW
jgi:predicted transcriptional regulator of viral defense system